VLRGRVFKHPDLRNLFFQLDTLLLQLVTQLSAVGITFEMLR
jgi:hypothetical protein